MLDALRRMLGDAGYAIRQVAHDVGDGIGTDTGERAVRHSVATVGTGTDAAERHEVAVGDARFRRAYRTTGADRVVPASALFVRGLDGVSIRTIDDALFEPPPRAPSVDGLRAAADLAPAGDGGGGRARRRGRAGRRAGRAARQRARPGRLEPRGPGSGRSRPSSSTS